MREDTSMENIAIEAVAAAIADQLPRGAFLCVEGDTPNVMTVGWGGLAYYWKKHVYVAPVRQQRHTYPLLKAARRFTISVPHPGAMAKELAQAGTLSGRDGDKFEAMSLKTRQAKTMPVPVVEGCAWYLECVVLAENAFDAAGTDASIVDYTYKAGDFHTLFYGDVVACYAGDAT